MSKKKTRSPDFLDEMMGEFTAENPEFPKMVEAALRRRELGRELAACRERLGLSQTQLAARIKTSQAQVSKIESGADVRLSTLARYAAAVGCELRVSLRRQRSAA